MDVTRRQFVVLAAAACSGFAAERGGPAGPAATRVIDAGPEALYAADGIYDRLRHKGFFLVRESGQLIALSSDCTHRNCPLRVSSSDRTFTCKCHGSRFDDRGVVLKGPAERSLPRFSVAANAEGHLIVEVTRLNFDEE